MSSEKRTGRTGSLKLTIASFEITLFGTITKAPARVRSLVARQVISSTTPTCSPTRIQWPTRNGFSIWMARPAMALPSVSCSAKPTTTAPAADAATMPVSRSTKVVTRNARTTMAASWTMLGKRADGRSARNGLRRIATAAMMIASAIRRLSSAAMAGGIAAASSGTRMAPASARATPPRAAAKRSLPRATRLRVANDNARATTLTAAAVTRITPACRPSGTPRCRRASG